MRVVTKEGWRHTSSVTTFLHCWSVAQKSFREKQLQRCMESQIKLKETKQMLYWKWGCRSAYFDLTWKVLMTAWNTKWTISVQPSIAKKCSKLKKCSRSKTFGWEKKVKRAWKWHFSGSDCVWQKCVMWVFLHFFVTRPPHAKQALASKASLTLIAEQQIWIIITKKNFMVVRKF